jgi:hypothetical protein
LFFPDDRFFTSQNLYLLSGSAIIAAECSIGSDNAVTWDFRVVIFIQNVSNRAIRTGASRSARNIRIRQRRSAGNLRDNHKYVVFEYSHVFQIA